MWVNWRNDNNCPVTSITACFYIFFFSVKFKSDTGQCKKKGGKRVEPGTSFRFPQIVIASFTKHMFAVGDRAEGKKEGKNPASHQFFDFFFPLDLKQPHWSNHLHPVYQLHYKMNTYYEWLLVFIALFVPPVSILIKYPPLCLQRLFFVVIKRSKKPQYVIVQHEFLTSCALFFVGYIPALIHSLYLISKNDDHYRYYYELSKSHKQRSKRKRAKSTPDFKSHNSSKNPVSRVKNQSAIYGSV